MTGQCKAHSLFMVSEPHTAKCVKNCSAGVSPACKSLHFSAPLPRRAGRYVFSHFHIPRAGRPCQEPAANLTELDREATTPPGRIYLRSRRATKVDPMGAHECEQGPLGLFHCLEKEYSPDGSRSFRAFTWPFSITNS